MTRTTRDGVAKGRGRGKSTPKPRTPSSRVKRVSLKRKENEETEEYLSAAESLTDIIITNGSISDVMQSYEDSILEDDAFELPDGIVSNDVIMVQEDVVIGKMDEEVVGGDVGVLEENQEHVVDHPADVTVNGSEVVPSVGEIDDEVNIDDGDEIIEQVKVVAGGEGSILVSMPEGVRSIDRKYMSLT